MYSIVKEVEVERISDAEFDLQCDGTRLTVVFDNYATADHVERTILKLSNAIQPKISYYFGK